MDLSSLFARLRALVAKLGCSPAELVAVAVLVAASLGALGILWLRTPPAETVVSEPSATAAEDGDHSEAGHEHGEHDGHGADDGPLALTGSETVVHVAGAVQTPGLYELPVGARVSDAVQAAGGPSDDAVLDAVNLAREVTDGERLVVPGKSDLDEGAQDATLGDGKVDLNQASAADLEALPGVGPVTAERIVEHREAHGPFTHASDLLDVSGIGERTFESLADLVGT